MKDYLQKPVTVIIKKKKNNLTANKKTTIKKFRKKNCMNSSNVKPKKLHTRELDITKK